MFRLTVSHSGPRVLDLYNRSSKRGPEDDSVESKHVASLSHYMFNITTVVFDGHSPPFYCLLRNEKKDKKWPSRKMIKGRCQERKISCAAK